MIFKIDQTTLINFSSAYFFACTLTYKESIGAILMSVASLCLEFCMCQGSSCETKFHENLENHGIYVLEAFNYVSNISLAGSRP